MSAVSALPVPLVCSECGETGRTYFSRTSRKLGFCRHCQPVNPRWRDWHTLPDERLLRPIQTWFYRRKRIDSDGHVQYPLHLGWLVILLARYALRHAGLGMNVADRIRAEKVPCPDHPMTLPKPSCWTCGRNGAFERAARIAQNDTSTPCNDWPEPCRHGPPFHDEP